MIRKEKQYSWLWAFAIILLLVPAMACSKDNKDIIKGTIFYCEVSPDSRDFLLNYYDLSNNKIIDQLNLGPIFSRNVFHDYATDSIWVPAVSTKDLSTVSNKVKIIKSKIINEIEVGISPVDIKYSQSVATITCLESGFNDVTTYFVDTQNYKILDKVKLGGDIFEYSDIDKDKGIIYTVTQDVDNKVSIVSVLDSASHKLINQFRYPNISLYGVKFVNKELWICGGRQLIMIDPKTGEKTETIKIDSFARQLVSDGEKLVVSHYYPEGQKQEGITIINLNDRTMKRLAIGDVLPSSIALDGNNLYIVDEMTGILNIYDMRFNTKIKTYTLGQYPTNIEFIQMEGF